MKDQNKDVPQNEFRDELAKDQSQPVTLSEEVSIPRDQQLLRTQLAFQAELVGMSQGHLGEAIEVIEVRLEILQGLPDSNGRLKVIAGVTQQLETTKQALAATQVGWQDRAYMNALAFLNKIEPDPRYPQSRTQEEGVDGGGPAPPSSEVAAEGAASKMGPIQTDEDNDDDDDD